MDAFYASVEQRDDAQLRGKPVIVAWQGKRSVVCAASYEARAFGVHSAMPAVRAEHLCPSAIFVAPDFSRYRAVSNSVREIFKRHTDLIEPLSLDEAHLDVTENKAVLPTATLVARTIRRQIRRDCLGGSGTQQVPGETRLGLAQTGWALRHSARGDRWVSRAIARWTAAGRRESYRREAGETWYPDGRRFTRTGSVRSRRDFRPLWRAVA